MSAGQELLDKPQALFALVLSPTRELAIQISEQFEALGAGISVKCSVLVGGIDMMAQAVSLAKRPHIIVGTPGRVVDHLSNTKVRSLEACLCPKVAMGFGPPKVCCTKRKLQTVRAGQKGRLRALTAPPKLAAHSSKPVV